MKFIKSKNGERVTAVSESGETIAYIEKYRFGTHGHWHGWHHYVFCERVNKHIWAGVDESIIYPERPRVAWKNWTSAPEWFANVKAFKTFYLENNPA